MDKRDLNCIKAPTDKQILSDDLIKDLNKASDILFSIQKKQNEADRLMNSVNDKIYKLVHACYSVDELQDLCKSIGLDKSGYRWGWEKAYKNSFEEDTDHEKTEWHDIIYHTEIDIRLYISKKAKERWREEHKMNGDNE